MKRKSVFACAAAMVICGWITGVQAGVVAYYDFAGSGTNDASGHGYSLTSTGSVVFANHTAVFNGTTAPFLSSGALLTGTYSNLTVEFYMKTTTAVNKQLLELGPSGTSTGNKGAFDFYYQGSSDSGKLYAFYQASGGSNKHVSPAAVNDGNWHHVAMVIDASKAGTTNYVSVYVDRQAIPLSPSDNGLNNIRNDRLYIGARVGTADPFAGQLDDIRISDTALNTNDFLMARSEFSVLAYYRFDSTNALADASGNGKVLTSAGNVSFTNNVAVFSGGSPNLTSAALASGAYSNLTVEFFIKTTAAQNKQILELSPNHASYAGAFDFYYHGSTEGGDLHGIFNAASGTDLHVDSNGRSVSDGYWHHVAMVIDSSKTGTVNYVQVYLDRQLITYTTPLTVLTPIYNGTIYIGARSVSTDSFTGQLDDIRICTSVLPPEQFLVSRTGVAVVPPEVIAYWKFDDSNPLADSSGNGYTLTSATGMTTDKCAAVFTGTQGCKTAKNLNLVPYGDLTIELFIKTTAAENKQIFELSSNYASYDGSWDFYYHGATEGGALHGIFNTGGDGYNHHRSTGSVTNGNWHHVALVIDSSKADTADYVQLYLDKTASPYYGGVTETRWARSPLRSDTVYIGGRNLIDYLFTGQLDDIKITAAALPVSAFMTKRSFPPGLMIRIH